MYQRSSKSELSRGNSDHFVFHANFDGNAANISAEISTEWVAGSAEWVAGSAVKLGIFLIFGAAQAPAPKIEKND